MLDLPQQMRRRMLARRTARFIASEAGDTMIEVLVASLLVALIAAAVFTGFTSVADIAGSQRHQVQANALAEQDEEHLRGLSVGELTATAPTSPSCGTSPGLYGNECYALNVDNETYTVTSTATFVSASGATTSCSASGTGSADYIETASTVTWANSTSQPVSVHSLISPHTGGATIIETENETGTGSTSPEAGVPIDITGPGTSTNTQALTTDANGCAVFAGLDGGTYNLSWPGYITPSGATSQPQIVVAPGTSPPTPIVLAQPGAINAQFTTTYTGATGVSGSADTFIVNNGAYAAPLVFGTPGIYQSSVTSSTTLYPFSASQPYNVYAGACPLDAQPPSPGAPTAVVTAGATTNVTVPEPALIVEPWSGTPTEVDDTSSSVTYYSGAAHTTGTSSADGDWYYEHLGTPYTYYNSTAHYDGTAGDKVEYTFTGNFVQWLEPTSNNYGYGNAAIYSGGQPASGSPVSGTSVTNIDGYSAVASYGSMVAYSEVLPTSGTYTLVITVDGTDDGKPTSGNHQYYVVVDAIIGGTVALLSAAPHVTIMDNTCSSEDVPPTSVPTLARGGLTDPGYPYGTFTVCADNGSKGESTTVANTSFTTGNIANLFLITGEPGLISGACT
jgi:Flp pilus assembly pilin Flp